MCERHDDVVTVPRQILYDEDQDTKAAAFSWQPPCNNLHEDHLGQITTQAELGQPTSQVDHPSKTTEVSF